MDSLAAASWDATPPVSLAVTRYICRIYLLMCAGIAVTAGAAALVAHNDIVRGALFTPTGVTGAGWAVMLAPMLLVVTISTAVHRISPRTARALFYLYAALVGLSLGTVTYAVASQSLAATLLATSGAFAMLALAGWVAKADFSPFGPFSC